MMHARSMRRRPRRGAALLLVLVALAVALLLVATWLDGRRESVPVAQRVSSGAVARHAAATGLALACATIDADEDWRISLQTGALDGAFSIDDVDVRFTFEDAESGDPPDDETVRLRIRCEATAGDIPGIIEGVLEVAPEETVVDVTYGETAIIARDRVRVRDQATVLPWTGRPGDDGGVLVLGTFDGDPDAVSIDTGALVVRSEIVAVESGPLAKSSEDRGRRILPDPLPSIPTPPSIVASPAEGATVDETVRLRDIPTARVDARTVRIPGAARWTVARDLEIRADRHIKIDRGATIVVECGTLSLEAGRDVDLRGATILIRPGGRLEIRGGDTVKLVDATVGQTTEQTLALGLEGMLPLDADARSVVVVAEPDGMIVVGGRSLVAATLLAPDAAVTIEESAILHGRVVAADALIRDDAVIFARPDDGRIIGLTTPQGPHRTDTGELIPQLTEIERTDDSFLTYLAEMLEIPVSARHDVVRPLLVSTSRTARSIGHRMQQLRRSAATTARWTWIDPHGDRR